MILSRHILSFFALSGALILAACSGPSEVSDSDASEDTMSAVEQAERAVDAAPDMSAPPTNTAPPVPMTGRVTLTVDRLIEERDPNNCLVMMQVANGTDETVSAGLFAFDVEGDGLTAGGNMFPQRAAPGERATAQVILPGQTCAVAERIVGGQPACMTDGDESCVGSLDFEDGEVDFTIND